MYASNNDPCYCRCRERLDALLNRPAVHFIIIFLVLADLWIVTALVLITLHVIRSQFLHCCCIAVGCYVNKIRSNVNTLILLICVLQVLNIVLVALTTHAVTVPMLRTWLLEWLNKFFILHNCAYCRSFSLR